MQLDSAKASQVVSGRARTRTWVSWLQILCLAHSVAPSSTFGFLASHFYCSFCRADVVTDYCDACLGCQRLIIPVVTSFASQG